MSEKGWILNLKFRFLPSFLIYIFSPNKIYYNEGVRAASGKLSAFLQYCKFKSIGEKYTFFLPIVEKICFLPIGEKYAFSPLFASPFNHFFPQRLIWPYFWVKKKNIHQEYVRIKSLEIFLYFKDSFCLKSCLKYYLFL